MKRPEKLQEYLQKLESLRGLLNACESEAEECLGLAPSEACHKMIEELISSIKDRDNYLREAVEYWRHQLEEG
ncbi:MAG: hypothetical protein RMI51_04310 [Aquificaceae bacterium]|nr:hypothetical protein [Aquificaceae bacterium]